MSGEDLFFAGFFVVGLSVYFLDAYRSRIRGGTPTDPASAVRGPSSLTGFYLFLWLLIVVAIIIGVALLRPQ